MTTPSFFLGSALKFAVAGEGVSFDPATGEIRVTTAALTAGVTVTVTPVDDQGVAGAPFRLTVAATPGATDVAPSLLTPPTLEGSGLIGTPLVVASGSWGGVPAPAIALQWLRGGVEIAGATADTYVPQAGDEGQEITVRVTASNAAGALVAVPEAVVAKAATPLPLPPLLLAAPVLAGAGKVGSPLGVEPGSWSGDPAIALQWLRDGAEIAGATAATYVPADADDRATLAVRVTASNVAGSQTVVTDGIAVTQVAPTLVGELYDEVLDREDGSVPVETAQVFSGRALGYGVTGGGATIDAATGVLSLPTGTVLSGETVTVTATNSGGSAEASFLLTIEDPDAFPLPLADSAWSAVEVRDVAPAGRRRIEVAGTVVVPEGFELRLYSGPQAGGVQDLTGRILTPGVPFTTNGTLAVGSTCYTLLFWRRIEDGAWAPASREVVLQVAGLDTTTTPPTGSDGYAALPAANVVSAASWSAVDALIAARIASGVAGTYYIDLPNGNYGAPVVNRQAGSNQTIIIRSQNKNVGGTHIGGAKFTGLTFGASRGIYLEFVDFDRAGLGWTHLVVDMRTSMRCGISYSRFRVTVPPSGGYTYDSYGGVQGVGARYTVDATGTGPQSYTDTTPGVTLFGNAFVGLSVRHIYTGGSFNAVIEQNVFSHSKEDNIHVSWGGNQVIRDNWHARDIYSDYNPNKPSDPWNHCDWLQADGGGTGAPLSNFLISGNVGMLRDYNSRVQANPVQGMFSSSQGNQNWVMEQNIVVTNTSNGLQIGGPAANNSGHVIRRNTLLRCIDYPDVVASGSGVRGTFVSAAPGVVAAECVQNVVTKRTSEPAGFGSGGLAILGGYNSWAAIDRYYTSARRTSTFYELRPVTGQPTHWAYSAGPAVGAAEKFRRTLVDKVGFPKVGPAWALWKQDYDWKNQIMGAA